MKDLFQFPDEIPQEVNDILDKYDLSAMSYEDCKNMLIEVKKIGYTFDYGLSAEPYELQRIANFEEKNIELAKFLKFNFSRFETEGVIERLEDDFLDITHKIFSVDELTFNSDWSMLMDVVEAIESKRDGECKMDNDDILAIVTIESNYCEIRVYDGILEGEGFNKKEAVFNACFEFVKWYDQQNEKPCLPSLEIKTRDRIAIVNHDINCIKKHR